MSQAYQDDRQSNFEKAGGHGKHQIMQSLNYLENMRKPGVEHSVKESHRALAEASEPLIKACQDAMDALLDSLHENNSRRWFGKLSIDEFHQMRRRHEAALDNLKKERENYPIVANKLLLGTHDYLFDESGNFVDKDSSLPKLGGLFIGFNFEDRLVRFAETLERPLAQVILLESERTKRRFWAPAGIRKFFSWAFGSSGTPVLNLPTSQDFPEIDKDAMKEMHEKLNGSSKVAKKRSKFASIILGVAHWMSDENGVYAMRVVIATIAVSVIAVTTETAGFFYRKSFIRIINKVAFTDRT